MIAALYVETNGVYYGLPDVDPWDEARDARLYAGPWPVVAHPPCARWCALAPMMESMHGYKVGDDAGMFYAALTAVQRWGGVLEHPAGSFAWDAFHLPRPARFGWASSFTDPGLTTEVDQAAYGHRARKRTWLYFVGKRAPGLRWDSPQVAGHVSSFGHGCKIPESERVRPAEASRTPPAFRDVLLNMARSCMATRRPLLAGVVNREPLWTDVSETHAFAETAVETVEEMRRRAPGGFEIWLVAQRESNRLEGQDETADAVEALRVLLYGP